MTILLDAKHKISYHNRMNKLTTQRRVQILSMLVEGMSMRSISRVTGASINTVTKLLVDAGNACAEHHDTHVKNVKSKRVQCDEIWSFCYAKEKNVATAKAAPEGAGDVWTWTAIDADNKLIISYFVGDRNADNALELMTDVKARLSKRVQLTTDGLKVYLEAVEESFGGGIDYAQLIKLYGPSVEQEKRYSPSECVGIEKRLVSGSPDDKHISTSYVERHNLTMRMSMRRFTRLTNAFSKKIQNHIHMLSLYFVYYNFCKIHMSLRVTPAMEAGLCDELRDLEWIVRLIDAQVPKPKKRGPHKKKDKISS